jgi:phage-related protein (TIGR01555 family)
MQRRFWNAMQAQSIMESNFGMRIINHGDAIHHQQYSFSGLPEVYDRIMMDVAGAAKTPVTKLFGRSPAGMNATGEADLINYYDYLDTVRESQFRPVLEKLLPIMAMSAWGQIPDDLDITFPALSTPDPAELAGIVQTKTAAITAAYQADLIDAATAMRELQEMSEETGTFTKIKDEDVTAAEGKTFSSTRAMQDPMSGLFSLPEENNGDEDDTERENAGGVSSAALPEN